MTTDSRFVCLSFPLLPPHPPPLILCHVVYQKHILPPALFILPFPLVYSLKCNPLTSSIYLHLVRKWFEPDILLKSLFVVLMVLGVS